MAFLLFERAIKDGKPIIRPTGETFSLAGDNLIYQAWEQKGKPINTGWQVTADELIRLRTGNANSYVDRRLVIDFHPTSTWRIGLKELLDIYAFTWSDENGGASWTPLMLRMRDVFDNEDFDEPITESQKVTIMTDLPEPTDGSLESVEFLYLTGLSWNWGKTGSTNAAFLYGAAREYFRTFF